jgi:hypothetical protein
LSRFTLRLVTLALVSAVVVIGGASTALASLATATQNAEITVVASLESTGGDGVATAGDTVTANVAVTNNAARKQVVKVSATLTGPDGVLYSRGPSVMLSPGETYSASDSLLLTSSTPAGSYTLTITASNKNGSSSASTSITVY